jgi:hypothetical protein
MVLMAIVGELGGGKTLALSYLAWNNYYYKDRHVWTNYNLFGIPFRPVRSLEDLNDMIPMRTLTAQELMERKEIFFAGDELWRWIDSRATLETSKKSNVSKVKNRTVTNILSASRKASVTIAYTAQTFGQVDKRIRDVTDFICYPMILGDGFMCRVTVFKGSKAMIGNIMPDIRFYAEPIFSIYNTYEVVEELQQEGRTEEMVVPISQNPAWLKYLHDKGYDEAKILKQCAEMEKMITKPSDCSVQLSDESKHPDA